MPTKTDLSTRVLQNIKVLQAGETPEAGDQSLVQDRYDDAYYELQERGIAYWPIATIPVQLMAALEQLISARVAIKFMDASEAVYYESRVSQAMRDLEGLSAQTDDSARPVQANYF